jgi:acetyl-CoA carboxylase biotin carboxyl carrier protein
MDTGEANPMNLDAIRELIALMKANQIDEVDWESGGEHIRLKAAQPPAPVYVAPPHAAAPAAHAVHPAAAAEPPEAEAEPDHGIVIKSPIVGVYYAAPGPDKPPFVEVGQEIDENTVICIIEAMKVMNEIKAEVNGTVREILIENSQSVEFGQPLMVIEPAEA